MNGRRGRYVTQRRQTYPAEEQAQAPLGYISKKQVQQQMRRTTQTPGGADADAWPGVQMHAGWGSTCMHTPLKLGCTSRADKLSQRVVSAIPRLV